MIDDDGIQTFGDSFGGIGMDHRAHLEKADPSQNEAIKGNKATDFK